MKKMSRRNLAISAAAALAAGGIAGSSAAVAAGDNAAVENAVEALRQALFKANKAELEKLASTELSYGHSDGRVQNKAEFVDGVMTRKSVVKSLEFPELKVSMAGDAAIVRHLYVAESETDGKANSIKLGVLAVWQKQGGGWKLLARQGYKLAA